MDETKRRSMFSPTTSVGDIWRIASLSVLGKGLMPLVFTSTDVNCASIPRKQECPVRRVAPDAGASANVCCRREAVAAGRSSEGLLIHPTADARLVGRNWSKWPIPDLDTFYLLYEAGCAKDVPHRPDGRLGVSWKADAAKPGFVVRGTAG